MPAITKERLLIEKAANQAAVAEISGRLNAARQMAERVQIELNANVGVGQFIDYLILEADKRGGKPKDGGGQEDPPTPGGAPVDEPV